MGSFGKGREFVGSFSKYVVSSFVKLKSNDWWRYHGSSNATDQGN